MKTPPKFLQNTQEWFAKIITTPIDSESRIQPITPSGRKIEEEAAEHILPSPTLKPYERIQIYNQQYWWRLLSTLQETYPLVLRLFGYQDFNQMIGFPYLASFPPKHWSLNDLGDDLPTWVKQHYQAEDQPLILDCAMIDRAFHAAFVAGHLSFSSFKNRLMDPKSNWNKKKLKLQPHLFLFELKADLFEFRQKMLKKEPDYWVEHDFPNLKTGRSFFFILYRNPKNQVTWRQMDAAEYKVLSFFKKGATIDALSKWLDKQSEDLQESAAQEMQNWFLHWTKQEFLRNL